MLVCAAVVQGQAKPLMRPAQVCPAIHGESGLEFLDGSSMQARPSSPASFYNSTLQQGARVRALQVLPSSPALPRTCPVSSSC